MKNFHLKYKDSTISTSSASFNHRTRSPCTSATIQGLPPRSRLYKSPNSTPTTSPMPSKLLSFDEISQCFSDKKDLRGKDQTYYLRQKIQIQEKRILLLEEENKRLSQEKRPEFWEKELLKRNDEIRKLENQLRYYIELAGEQRETERLMDDIVEKDNYIEKLRLELNDVRSKCGEYEKAEVEERRKRSDKENLHLNCLKKEECEILLSQIQELEVTLELQAKENKELKELNKGLKEENSRYEKEVRPGSLMYFSQDLNKIKREMSKLAKILDDFVQGKEFTLKGLLGIENEWKNDPVQQISMDIQSVKSDLNHVLTVISDIHAEQCANIVCRNQ